VVHLTRIYTRTGDGGATRLADLSEVAKTDPRVAAYGDVDEANSNLGVALALDLPDRAAEVLRFVQNELFDVGADLATPYDPSPTYPPLRIEQESINRLEAWCDELSADLPELSSFILPGGRPAAAQLHVCRTVVRRAERTAWAAVEAYGSAPTSGGLNPLALTYLNRLSDLLFILARSVNGGASGDVTWVPGSGREIPRRRHDPPPD